jgi:hypothetical protein
MIAGCCQQFTEWLLHAAWLPLESSVKTKHYLDSIHSYGKKSRFLLPYQKPFPAMSGTTVARLIPFMDTTEPSPGILLVQLVPPKFLT